MSLQGNDSRQAPRARVFISYKHAQPDQDLAEQLCNALALDHDVFIDQQIPAGENWARRINEELDRTDVFVVLLSKLSVESEMVVGEINYVRDRAGKRPLMLPVCVDYHEPLPYPLNAYFKYVNWVEWQTPDDTPRAIRSLLWSIRRQNGDSALQIDDGPDEEREVERGPLRFTRTRRRRGKRVPKQEWDVPKGALRVDSPLYVERPSDEHALGLIGRRGGVTIAIRGPRQIGKTSLLARIADAATRQGKRIAWIDFQLFETGSLMTGQVFYQQLCSQISDSLDLEPRIADYWNDENGDGFNCRRYMERYVLPNAGGPVVLAIDEADRIFGALFRADFFGMLRSWHNQRATSEAMRRLDIVLVASTVPQMYIADPLQSPFNVAENIRLADFTLADAASLNARYWSPLSDDQLRRLLDLVGGHPFLTHYGIYSVATGSISLDRLFATAPHDDGPFDDHLRHLLLRLHGVPELSECLRQIIGGETCVDERMYYRLSGAGLVRREGSAVVPRCRLYADFFRERL